MFHGGGLTCALGFPKSLPFLYALCCHWQTRAEFHTMAQAHAEPFFLHVIFLYSTPVLQLIFFYKKLLEYIA